MALTEDELELISKKLTFEPDYTRFRSVCRSWRSAAPKRPQLPWLIATDSNARTNFLYFYRFSFETNKFTLIPELSKSPLSSSSTENSTVCIGSSHGWMALFNRGTSSVSLFNPLTNSNIHLPDLQNKDLKGDIFGHYSSHSFSFNLTSDPGESLSDCLALIYCSDWILYCKVGCSGWIEFKMPHPEFYWCNNIHICCYHGKLFIAWCGDVFVFDYGRNPSVCKVVSVSSCDISEFKFVKSYLVESDGDLLLVLVYDTDYSGLYHYFQVFKLKFGRLTVKLVELTSLGDKALFFSHNTTFFLTASKSPGCKENSFYSTSSAYNFKERRTFLKLIIYDFEGGTNVLINDEVVTWNQSGWFAPSLLM